MTREKLFAGYDKQEGKMAWIEVEIRVFEGKKTFTLSGNECYVTKWGREEKEDYIRDLIDSMDSDWVLNRLKEQDCSWSELPEALISEFEYNESFGDHYYDVNTLRDDEGNDYQCDVSGCGQCDIRDFIHPLTPQISRLMEIWDEYHLKVISDEVEQEVLQLIDDYEKETEEMNDELYGTSYLADNIFKDICEYQFDAEGLY